jgi:hypothetical protein
LDKKIASEMIFIRLRRVIYNFVFVASSIILIDQNTQTYQLHTEEFFDLFTISMKPLAGLFIKPQSCFFNLFAEKVAKMKMGKRKNNVSKSYSDIFSG